MGFRKLLDDERSHLATSRGECRALSQKLASMRRELLTTNAKVEQARLDVESEKDETHRVVRDSRAERERMQVQASHEISVSVSAAVREQKRAFASKIEALENTIRTMRATAAQHSDVVSSLEESLRREEGKVLDAEAQVKKLMQRIEKLTLDNTAALDRESQKRVHEVHNIQARSELSEKKWATERDALEMKSSTALKNVANELIKTRSELTEVLAAKNDLQSQLVRKQSSFEYELKSKAAELVEARKTAERAREDAAREIAQLRQFAREEKERHAAEIEREQARVEVSASHEEAARKAAETSAQEASERVKSAREEGAESIAALQRKLVDCLSARASRIEELETERDELVLSQRRKEAEASLAQAQLENRLSELMREKDRALQRESKTSAIVDMLRRDYSDLERKRNTAVTTNAAASSAAAPPAAVPPDTAPPDTAPPAAMPPAAAPTPHPPSKPVPKTMNAGRLKLLQQEMRARRLKREREPEGRGEEAEEEEEASTSDEDGEEKENEAEKKEEVSTIAVTKAVEYIPGSLAADSYWISKDPLMAGRLSQSREAQVTLSMESKDLEVSLAAAKKGLASRSASLRRAGRRIEAQRLRIMQLEAKLEKKTKKVSALTVELGSLAEEKRRLSAAKTSLASRAKNELSRAMLLATELEQHKRTCRLLAEKLQTSAEHLEQLLVENARLRDERVDAESLSLQLRGAQARARDAETDLSTLRRFQHLALGLAQDVGTKGDEGHEADCRGRPQPGAGPFGGGAPGRGPGMADLGLPAAQGGPSVHGCDRTSPRGVPLTPNAVAPNLL